MDAQRIRESQIAAKQLAKASPARFSLALLNRSGEFFSDGVTNAGDRQEMNGLLDGVPIFFGNQNGIGARACNEGGFVSSRRLIKETVQLLTGLAGVHDDR